jgi:hypothetical protein
LKKTIIIGFIGLLWLPFVLMNDIFPFFRFGMFAEPAQKLAVQEVFILTYSSNNQVNKIYDTNELGIDEAMLNYLARKYYYQKQMPLFFQRLQKSYLNQSSKLQKVQKFTLLKLNISTKQTDSVFVGSHNF